MKITFIANPIKTLDSDDSTTEIIKESVKRSHQVYIVERHNIFWKEGELFAQAINYSNQKIEKIILEKQDVIMMRQDPPFDMDYIYLTYLLEQIKDKTLIINNPSSVRSANEKFFILNFQKYIPPTLITKSSEEIKSFLKQFSEGIILKPLDNKGGTGIFHIHKNDVNRNEIIKTVTENETKFIMAQKFLKEIKNGDKRVTILNGEILNTFVRIPHKEDFRGNLHSGATAKKAKLTEKEVKMVKEIAEKLKKLGLYLVGLDIIGSHLTEINVTSPITGHQLFPKVSEEIVNFLENL
ncbi:glutathione synthase [Candidatus Peregrinibacteria bacterium RIFOXYB2_FULL_32_7]|nr:MAG: glutathione synthase [Candidatus Peregrinibacteria bacterium RIFOXYB2_FULL_32_7]